MRSATARQRLGLAAICCCFVVGLSIGTPQLEAATYYVSTSGDDTNAGTSSATAFRTIKRAATVIQSGDWVYVAAGTYTEDVVVNGVQQWAQTTKFIASSGVTVAAQWKVLNSNHVSIDGFTFQGTTSRFLVWHGSYEGTLQNCTFNAGNEGLLIKDGSLTVDNCQIQTFTHDGIQVDGESRLTITDSTISGCQENGVEIRTVAHVVLDNCDVTGQVGSGVEVSVTGTSIDDGISPSDLSLGTAPLAVSDGTVSFGGQNFIDGDFHHTPGVSVDASHVNGSVNELPSGALSPINPGDAATNNNNANIPLTSKGDNPLDFNDNFSLDTEWIDLPPGTYYFNDLLMSGGSEIRISGETIIYTTGNVVLKGITNPAQDPNMFQLYSMGPSVDIQSQADVYAAIYAPTSSVSVSGGATFDGMLVAGSLSMGGSALIRPNESLTDLALSLMSVPQSTSSPTSWTPVGSGELDISDSTITGNEYGVRLVTDQSFTSSYTDYSSNSDWGLCLTGTLDLDDCTIASNGIGGVWLHSVVDSDVSFTNIALTGNTQFGFYADSSQVTVAASDGWSMTGSEHAILGYESQLTVTGLTLANCTTAAIAVSGSSGTLTATSLTANSNGYGIASTGTSSVVVNSSLFSSNGVGLYSSSTSSVSVSNSTFSTSTTWGSAITASGPANTSTTFSACTFDQNAGGGIAVTNIGSGDLTLSTNTVMSANTQTGLHIEDSTVTLNGQAGNWSITGSGISCRNSTLTLNDIVIPAAPQYGLVSEGSHVSMSNCEISGVGGVLTDSANLSVNINASRFAATIAGGSGLRVLNGDSTVKNCVFDGFDTGIYVDTRTVDDVLIANTTLARIAAYGIVINDGDAEVRNTIVTGSSGQTGIAVMNGNLTHSHNLLYGFTADLSGTAMDSTELFRSPRFVDGTIGNFQLSKASPAINAGVDLSGTVTTDLDGNARPLFGAYDIGALEYSSGNGSFRVLNWKETE